MILEGLDGAFGPVAAMEARWGELVFNGLGGHEITEELRSFIVKTVELGAETRAL